MPLRVVGVRRRLAVGLVTAGVCDQLWVPRTASQMAAQLIRMNSKGLHEAYQSQARLLSSRCDVGKIRWGHSEGDLKLALRDSGVFADGADQVLAVSGKSEVQVLLKGLSFLGGQVRFSADLTRRYSKISWDPQGDARSILTCTALPGL